MKALLTCSLLSALYFMPFKNLQAQDYRLIAASSYEQNTLMDSFQVRYSWNRHEAPRSLFFFNWTVPYAELSRSLYDTLVSFYEAGNQTSNYSYQQFDFFDQLISGIDSNQNALSRYSITGYGSDTLIRHQEIFDNDQQIWKVSESTETVKSGNLTESINYRYTPNGKKNIFKRQVFHNTIENSDSLVHIIWDNQLNDWRFFFIEVSFYDSTRRLIRLKKYGSTLPQQADIQEWGFFPNGLQRSFKYTHLIDGQIQSNYSQLATLNAQGNYDTLETHFFDHDTLSGHHFLQYTYDQQDRLIKIEASSDPDFDNPVLGTFTFTYLNSTNKIATVTKKYTNSPNLVINHYYYETFNNNVSVKPVVESKELLLYPNPARNSFSFITEKNHAPFTLRLYDLKGNLSMEMSGNELGNQIALSPALVNGLYVYQLETPEKTYSGRVQIQR